MSCYLTLFYCLLDMSFGDCNVISLYFMCCSVNGSVFYVVVILLLNSMEVSMGGCALFD